MSRSRKKTPKLGFSSSTSEKDDKQRYNRRQRHAGKIEIAVDPEEAPGPGEHARSGTWNFAKDGKRWVTAPSPDRMRK